MGGSETRIRAPRIPLNGHAYIQRQIATCRVAQNRSDPASASRHNNYRQPAHHGKIEWPRSLSLSLSLAQRWTNGRMDGWDVQSFDEYIKARFSHIIIIIAVYIFISFSILLFQILLLL